VKDNRLTTAERELLAEASPHHLLMVEDLENQIGLFRAQVDAAIYPFMQREAQGRLDEATAELETVVVAIRHVLGSDGQTETATTTTPMLADERLTPLQHTRRKLDELAARFPLALTEGEQREVSEAILATESEFAAMSQVTAWERKPTKRIFPT
jgi:hypothetical protein